MLSIDQATVFVGSKDSKLYSLNASTGAVNWEYLTGGSISTSPVLSVDNAVVFVGSSDSHVYAIGSATGAQVWAVDTGGEVVQGPILSADGKTLFVVSGEDNTLLAIDSSRGSSVKASLGVVRQPCSL